MKKILLFCVLILFIISCNKRCINLSEEQREREIYKANKVKVCKRYNFQYKNGLIVDSTKKSTLILDYDKNGNEIRHLFIKDNDTIYLITGIKFDKSNNIIEETINNDIKKYLKQKYYTEKYTYDKNNNRIQVMTYNPDGTLLIKEFTKYNQFNKKTESIIYGSKGNIILEIKSRYIKNMRYDSTFVKGQFTFVVINSFDNNDNLLEEKWYYQEDGVNNKNIYHYNENNLRTESINFDKDSINPKDIDKYYYEYY